MEAGSHLSREKHGDRVVKPASARSGKRGIRHKPSSGSVRVYHGQIMYTMADVLSGRAAYR